MKNTSETRLHSGDFELFDKAEHIYWIFARFNFLRPFAGIPCPLVLVFLKTVLKSCANWYILLTQDIH